MRWRAATRCAPSSQAAARRVDGGGAVEAAQFTPAAARSLFGSAGSLSPMVNLGREHLEAMAETLFEELKRYVGFGEADGALLRAIEPKVAPHFAQVAEVFYDRILQHEGARKALVGGESAVGHLKITLQQWLKQLFLGPWDEAYYERRARIGRVHVRIALPQHYMFGAMHLLARELFALYDALAGPDAPKYRLATQKLIDLELAIMLHTYREDLMSQQARSERLSTFGQLVGSIGHELRNPLGVIETSTYILRSIPGTTDKGKKHIDRIETQVRLANEIVTKLLDMIRDKPLVREPINLDTLARDVAETLKRPAAIAFDLTGLERVPPIQGDPIQARQVLTNLMQNAIDALDQAGTVKVSASPDRKGVTVHVEDDGPGVLPELLHRLFEPLVTSKPHGVGLGLALVKRIAERHGGEVQVGKSALGGARFSVYFPAGER
jgi:two-component system, NtrC family, sensor histidine kinase HydH